MARLECYEKCPIKYQDGNRPCGYGVIMQPAGTDCRANVKKAFAPDTVVDMNAVTAVINEVTIEGENGRLGRVVSGNAIKEL